MIHAAARVCVCISPWILGGVCMYKRCPQPIAHCIPLNTQEAWSGQRNGRRRSSGFFLLPVAWGKQRTRSESVREKVWSDAEKGKSESERKVQRYLCPVEVCDVKPCAPFISGLWLSWDQHVFELHRCLIWQPELWVCQETWGRSPGGSEKCGSHKIQWEHTCSQVWINNAV